MYTVQEDGRIINEEGLIAVRWNTLTQKYVEMGPHEYLFVIRDNIALAWIYPEDVDRIISMTGGCCGGRALLCHPANELDVKRWLGISIW